jgi:hypothetical protein
MSMATSKKDASKAGKLLSSPKTSKTVKSVAGSDLAQAKHKPASKKSAAAKKSGGDIGPMKKK